MKIVTDDGISIPIENPAQFVESLGPISDEVFALLAKSRGLVDGIGIKGYVSVVKNQGRPDEQVCAVFSPAMGMTIFGPNLVPTAGRDWVHAQIYTNTSAGTIGANYIAVSDDATDPASGDTSLVGEITTGGLARALATTISHTVGTNVTTLAKTFTATASFTNLHKSAVFNNAGPPVAGNMPNAAKFTTDVANMVSGDTLTITWTMTVG